MALVVCMGENGKPVVVCDGLAPHDPPQRNFARHMMPTGAFELMRGGVCQRVTSAALNDAWARCELRLVARDFSALPVAARTRVRQLHRVPPDPTTH